MCNCVPKIAKYAHFCRRKHNKRVSKFCTIFRPFCTFLRKFVHSFFISNMNRSPARFLKTIGTFWGMSVLTLKLFLILLEGISHKNSLQDFFLFQKMLVLSNCQLSSLLSQARCQHLSLSQNTFLTGQWSSILSVPKSPVQTGVCGK